MCIWPIGKMQFKVSRPQRFFFATWLRLPRRLLPTVSGLFETKEGNYLNYSV